MAVRGMISCFIYLSPSIMFAHGAADDSKSADESQFLAHRRLYPNTTNGTAAVDEVNVSSQALAYCANGNKYEDCGYWGISQSECEYRGCCYTEHIGNGQKKCYYPPPTPAAVDEVNVSSQALASTGVSAWCDPHEDADTCCGNVFSKQKCPFIDCCNGARGKHYCSPVSGKGYDTMPKKYYFDCNICADANGGAGCYPDYLWASPRSQHCHTQQEHDASPDSFYWLQCGPSDASLLQAPTMNGSVLVETSVTAWCDPHEDADTCCGNPFSKQKCPFIDCCNGAHGKHYCSPVSGNGYDTMSKKYYFDCNICADGNDGAGCYPDYTWASPRSQHCHTQEEHDASPDSFYWLQCGPVE
jgi:hypothetical protein